MEPESLNVLTYLGKIGTVGNNKCVILQKKMIELLKLEIGDLVQITVSKLGVNQAPAGNRGRHIRENKEEWMKKFMETRNKKTELRKQLKNEAEGKGTDPEPSVQ